FIERSPIKSGRKYANAHLIAVKSKAIGYICLKCFGILLGYTGIKNCEGEGRQLISVVFV
ncbi:hypothetical protein, partial [Siminovitchia terrae]|uniref:hypothetical protein n=1 Tax=Siminovitchia terrae TaxID=1914933 RepID=UPI0028A8791C